MNLLSFFSQPAMLFGTLLVSVPIIIYLINRQRYQRRPWAAMEFLLRAMRKNRRRLRLENLLLLLIRCAVLLLLAVAMARPFLRDTTLGTVSTGSENWILAIDSSYSMNYKDGVETRFEAAQQSLSRIVQNLVDAGDRLAIMTLDAQPRVVLSPRQVNETNRGQILLEIANLEPGFESVNLASSLDLALDLSREFEAVSEADVALTGKRLLVFSDFQQRDWVRDEAAGGGARDPAVSALLRELREAKVSVRLAADRSSADRNLTLVDLTAQPVLASQDVWVKFVATVRNTGRENIDTAAIVLRVDGREERSNVLRVPAGATRTRMFPHRFTTPGPHSVTVEVQGDNLTTDNQRHLALRVLERADVLLVDGEPGRGEAERETLMLEFALMPEETDEFRRTPYQPVFRLVDQVLADEETGLDSFVCVMLANVAAADLPRSFLERLRSYVRRGGVLMVFAGSNVVPDEYNRAFHEDGRGLMPLEMLSTLERDLEPVHLRLANFGHPVAAYFLARSERSYLNEPYVEVKRFIKFARPEPDSDVAVCLRFDDVDESPAAFDGPYGQGRVLWFASSADQEWNDFSKYGHDFIPFVHESIPYLVKFGESRINLELGEPIREIVETADFASDVAVKPPRKYGAANLTRISKELEKLPDDRFLLLHEETRLPGIYEVEMKRPSAPAGAWTERRLLYAVNVDPREGELRSLTQDQFRDAFPDAEVKFKIDETSSVDALGGGSELWRHVLWAVLILLLAETVIAQLFGKGQR